MFQSITPKAWHVQPQSHSPTTPGHTLAVIGRQEMRSRRNLSDQFSPGNDHLSPVEECSEEEVDEEDVIVQLEAEIADQKRLYEINQRCIKSQELSTELAQWKARNAHLQQRHISTGVRPSL